MIIIFKYLNNEKIYHKTNRGVIIQDDCQNVLSKIPDKSVNLVYSDLPFGKTQNSWDKLIPSNWMWNEFDRILAPNGIVVLHSMEEFTAFLMMSNLKWYKFRWYWDKDKGSGFLNAKKMLLKQTEDICLFYKNSPTYNPQMVEAQADRVRPISFSSTESLNYGKVGEIKADKNYNPELRYPTNLIKYSSIKGDCNSANRIHPTQKPIDLLKWLILTYSNKNDIILDNCIGSGQTALACLDTNRDYIGFDNGKCENKKKKEYYNRYWTDISQERINTYLENK